MSTEEDPVSDDEMRAAVRRMALLMYANEPCRICGGLLTEADLHDGVFVGYSADNTSRAAHKACWDKQLPKEQWAKP